MRTAKITSLSGTLAYAYFAVKPPFNVQPFAQILQSFNRSIQPIQTSMLWVAAIGCLLNLGFFIFLMRSEAKGVTMPRATIIGLLLLLLPLAIFYLLFAYTANQVYNLS